MEKKLSSPPQKKKELGIRSSCVDIPLNTLSFNFSSTSQKRKIYPSKDKTGSFQVHRSGGVVSYARAQTFNCPRPTYLPPRKRGCCHARVTVPTFIGGLPWWLRWQRIRLQCGTPGFNPWVGKIPWRREWQPTPVFWPGEFHRQGTWKVTVHSIAKSPTQLSN